MKPIIISSLVVGFSVVSSHAQELYSADFSTEGQGLAHSTGAPPPVMTSIDGANWRIFWDVAPSTDSGGNQFITAGGALNMLDWGGVGSFETVAVDVSGKTEVVITGSGETIGGGFNSAGNSERFEWYYILDGGAAVSAMSFEAPYTGELNHQEVIDVTGVSSLIVGFTFNANGGNDGCNVAAVRVDESVPGLLSLSIDEVFLDEGEGVPGAVTSTSVTVSRTGDTSGELVVALVASEENQLALPATVTIAAGATTSEEFAVSTIDNEEIDGERTLTFSATAEGIVSATSEVITILDDEMPLPTLEVTADGSSLSENGGMLTVMIERIDSDGETAHVFDVTSSDESELTVSTGTITLEPANDFMTFTVSGVDDAEADGVQVVTIDIVEQNGLTAPGQITLFVTDDESFSAPSIVINEVRINDDGVDDEEYVELYSATPDISLDRFSLVIIGEGNEQLNSGKIDRFFDLSGLSFTGNYFLFSYPQTTFTQDLFENSDNITFLLVSDFVGAVNDDLDTDDNGVLDVTPWGEIIDGVALIEEVGAPPVDTEYEYGSSLGFPVVGPDGVFSPGHIFRFPDVTGDWVIGVFGADGAPTQDTRGLPNSDALGEEDPAEILGFEIDSSTGAGSVTFSGVSAGAVSLYVSGDLGQSDVWVEVETQSETDNQDGTFAIEFTDAGAVGQTKRFYRLGPPSVG